MSNQISMFDMLEDPGEAQPKNTTTTRKDTNLDEIVLSTGGKKARFRANLAAITTLKQLESGAVASPASTKTLARYVGWGGLIESFERPDGSVARGWNTEVFELRNRLTEDEYLSARASTTDSHYTSKEVAQAMWRAITRLGFTGGKILEPAVGVGNFLGLMPSGVYRSSQVHAVELDDLSARIATHLYPSANVHQQGFEDSNQFDPAPNTYDLVIGNPPFGSQRVYDQRHSDFAQHSIHNYFALKSVHALAPGGVLAFVISRFFLDSADNRVRAQIAASADFIQAIRLPNTAFKDNAGTEVTTDIVFLRKPIPGEPRIAHNWINTETIADTNPEAEPGNQLTVNEWFAHNPQMMLGQYGSFEKMRAGTGGALRPRPGQNTAALLNEALLQMPELIIEPSENPLVFEESTDLPENIKQIQVGAMFVHHGRVFGREANVDGAPRARLLPLSLSDSQRAIGLIGIRNCFEQLVEAELGNGNIDPEPVRVELNQIYSIFVAKHGFINRRSNKRLFRHDPDWSKVAGLEYYKPAVTEHMASKTGGKAMPESAERAEIFSRRVLYPDNLPPSVDTATDALARSLAMTGTIDLDYIASIYKSADQALDELGDLVFLDPESTRPVTREEYLSGDVKAKLQVAEEAALLDSVYIRNRDALRMVVPADIPWSDIEIRIGAHWLPEEVMTDFVRHITSDPNAEALYLQSYANWSIKARPDYMASREWATDRARLQRILENAIKQTSISIYDGQDDARVYNEIESQRANDKVKSVNQEFAAWIGNDPQRQARLSQLYNDRFNVSAEQVFNGDHLMFPGQVDDSIIKLDNHQRNAIWRIISGNRSTLLDHAVGAGKTYTMIAAAMEMKRLGTATKPMFVVPNHLVDQFSSEFAKLYPAANTLTPSKNDFTRANREILFSRIALGNWDGVIVPHSSFDLITVRDETKAAMIEEEVASLVADKQRLEDTIGGHSSIKEIERRIKTLTARLETLADSKDTQGFYFDQLGIDALLIDESQEYKNLMFDTCMNRVAGLGNPIGSKKAFQMWMKCLHVQSITGEKNIVFASGTPLSNAIPELYTLLRYLDYPGMKKLGFSHFDAWARLYTETTHNYEITPTLAYKVVSRVSRFHNLPELLSQYRRVADVVTMAEIEQERIQRGERPQIPAMLGGAPRFVITPRSQQQADFTDYLILRAGSLVLPDNMLALMVDARKAALDMRIIDPNMEDTEFNKATYSAQEICRIYNKTTDVRGTQLVFIDLSIPSSQKDKTGARIRELDRRASAGDVDASQQLLEYSQEQLSTALDGSNFSVYDDLRLKLLSAGIPSDQVAFMHDAETDAQKKMLFYKVNEGQVRVLIGSTQKMGAGTNVQKRLVALHHLDCPWRPSDLEQREGRILRQGNILYRDNPDFAVEIIRYATEKTLDSRMWQTIQIKAGWIQQVTKGSMNGERTASEGVDEVQLAAQMKAASMGDPRFLQEIRLQDDIHKLIIQKKGHANEQYATKQTIARNQETLGSYPKQIDSLQRELRVSAGARAGRKFSITVAGARYTDRQQAGLALIKHAYSSQRPTDYGGAYAGFDIALKPGHHAVEGLVYSVHLKCNQVDNIHKAGQIVTRDSNPVGLISSIHYAVTTNIDRQITNRQATVEEVAARQKVLLGKIGDWQGAVELHELIQELAALQEELKAEAGPDVPELGCMIPEAVAQCRADGGRKGIGFEM